MKTEYDDLFSELGGEDMMKCAAKAQKSMMRMMIKEMLKTYWPLIMLAVVLGLTLFGGAIALIVLAIRALM